MKVYFNDLLVVQRKVDNKIMEGLSEKPTPEMIYFAMLTEFFELANAIGTWKWWKKNHTLDKDKILDELADVIAFFLSFYIQAEYGELNTLDNGFEAVFNLYKNFGTKGVLSSITGSLAEGIAQPPESILLAAVFITHEALDIEWEDIENAYLKKSQENIDRQNSNY